MTFKQLPIGSNFEFDHSSIGYLGHSLARGPWTKTGARSYVKVGDTPGRYTTMRVGSVSAKVVKQNPSTVNASAVLKRGRSILARVKRVGNKLVIQPVERAARRAVKRVRRAAKRNPRTAKPMAWYTAILYRPDKPTNLEVKVEANTVIKARTAVRRQYPKLKIVSIKREAM